ncbi:MAG: hypothetical protein U0457_18790 [Candidatus Sericytochromatia bacterium]
MSRIIKYLILILSVLFLFSCSISKTPALKNNENNSFINFNFSEKKETQLKNYRTESFKENDLDKLIEDKKHFIKSDEFFKKEKHPDVVIDKIVLSESNKQIDDKGVDFITPDFSGKKVNITFFGKFEIEDFKPDEFFYINEANLLHLSYAGEDKPETKFLLDNAILLKPISSSKNYITVSIDTKYIPDFYLRGFHKISAITDKKKITSSLIRVGEGVKPNTTLTPEISKIELLKHDASKIVGLKLTGKNFMLTPNFTYVKVDGSLYPIYQTDILSDGVYETVVNLSSKQDFNLTSKHDIEYYSPFGMVYTEFSL